ncbi:MAG: TolC family protein [Rectinemataceae bacterium]
MILDHLRPGARFAALAATLTLFLVSGGTLTAPLAAQSADQAPAKSLSIEQAIAAGLASDPGVQSGAWDILSARARAQDAKYRMLPSLSASAGYTQLSPEPTFGFGDLPAKDLALLAPYASVLETLAPVFDDLLPTIDASKDIRLDLQYPIFTGFRLREAAEIAKLQSLGKEQALELAKRALTFEIRRAYWEDLRATANVESLGQSLELENVVRDETKSLVDQGMATTADQIAEDYRFDQTTLALDDAKSMQEMAYLSLSSLTGDQGASKSVAPGGYDLTTKPGQADFPSLGDSALDEPKLIEAALANRPETRISAVALNASTHAKIAAKGDLLPSVVLSGSLSYADPDQRLFPPVDAFNFAWTIGVRVKYDIGGVPGALERGKAAEADIEKARADVERQRNVIALDVRRCVLALSRVRNSLELTRGMVKQSEENLRVMTAKFDNGMAKRSELLQSRIALLRANFAVENKLIDVEIARADLARAAALETVR